MARRAALRAYRDGEALCDAGRTSEGMKQLQAAYGLAPELDGEWPDWAERMYAADAPVPLCAEDASAVQPELAAARAADEWLQPASLAAVRSALSARSFAVLDAFLAREAADALRDACAAAAASGAMHPPPAPAASRQGGRVQGGDQIMWVDDERQSPALREAVRRCDALVRALDLERAVGAPIGARLRPMVSLYRRGAAFSRHVDDRAGDGRCVSAVLYATERWVPDDGGCLRVYRPQPAEGAADADAEDDDAVADVAPLGGRLVLFFADRRCPHEVLPVRSDAARFAVTLWYKAEVS